VIHFSFKIAKILRVMHDTAAVAATAVMRIGRVYL